MTRRALSISPCLGVTRLAPPAAWAAAGARAHGVGAAWGPEVRLPLLLLRRPTMLLLMLLLVLRAGYLTRDAGHRLLVASRISLATS